MTRSEVATEASTVSQRVVGPILGIPFFLGLLALHSNNRVLLVWAMGYVACVLFPAAAAVSSAMATFVAPIEQERAYARATATWSVSVLLAIVVLFVSMQVYAYWPLASSKPLSQVLGGPSNLLMIFLMLGGVLLVPGFAAFGWAAGCQARSRPTHAITRFLVWCWKLSKKSPMNEPVA